MARYNFRQHFIALFSALGITLLVSRLILNFIFIEEQKTYANTLESNFIVTPTEPLIITQSKKDSLPNILLELITATPTSTSLSNNITIKGQEINKDSSDLPTSLSIPSINLQTSISPSNYTYVNNKKTWEVPKYNVGTPFDQVLNNLILFGHTGLYNSIFANLSNLKIGEEIIIGNETYQQKYLVEKNLITTVDNIGYIQPQAEKIVTLITCADEKRRIIVGILD